MKLWSIAALPFKVTNLHQWQNSHHLLTQKILLLHDSQMNLSAVDDGLIEIPYDSVSISQWVKVLHEGKMFLGKALNKQNNAVLARCLSKPFGIIEPQDFDWEIDVANYIHVYHTKVNPMLSPVGHTCKYTYEIKD